MKRQSVINDTLSKMNKLPDNKLQEVQDFVEFLLSRADEKLLVEGIQELTTKSTSFDFLKDEEDIYTVNDLKEKYK